MKIITVSFLMIAACGKLQANPCATKSASYLQRYVQTSGNCGAIPDQLVNISADGALVGAKDVTCDDYASDGCTQRNTNCKGPAVNGVTCSATSSLTFVSSGATASGVFSVACTGTAICNGSYTITATRQ